MSHEKFQSCITACYDCADACDHCATACLKEDNVKAMAKCIELDMYCAEICRVAASFMAKGDIYARRMCELCAEICEDCGTECEKHQHMQHCADCAKACFACADECRKMSEVAA